MKNMPNMPDSNKIGLYIHVPFCVSKCKYCSFYSIESVIDKKNRTMAGLYKSAIIRNVQRYIEQNEQPLTFDTVYFGGGTPSLLYSEISETVPMLPTTSNAEITIEANPCDIVEIPKMLEMLLNAGVNRISIGIQSLNDSILLNLGRRHDSSAAVESVKLAYLAGFRNISVDIMLGIPGQTMETLYSTIEALTGLTGVTHVSAYIYEHKSQEEILTEEDKVAHMYLETVELLAQHGFMQYEISNFCKRTDISAADTMDYRSRHNLKYWNCENYIGIGAAAHSFHGGKRFAVREDVDLFVKSEFQEIYVTEEKPASFDERVMLKLRLTDGLNSSDFEETEWQNLLKKAKQISRENSECIIVTEKSLSPNISLTAKGFLLANRIIAELLD